MNKPRLPLTAATLVAAAVYSLIGVVSAANVEWLGDQGNFNSDANWGETTYTIPGASDIAINNTNGGILIGSDWTIGGLAANATSGTGHFIQNAGSLTINTFEVEETDLEQNPVRVTYGGILLLGHAPLLGDSTGKTGTYKLSGGSITVNGTGDYGRIYVGLRGGTGTFTQTGGAVIANNLSIAEGRPDSFQGVTSGNHEVPEGIQPVATSGAYSISSGTITIADRLTVGRMGGNGTFTQTGGDITTRELQLADNIGKTEAGQVVKSSGTYSISDGTLTMARGGSIGWRGDATFTQTGGTVKSTEGELWIGNNYYIAGFLDNVLYRSDSKYNMTGGTLEGNFGLGRWGGKGTFNMSGDDTRVKTTGGGWLDVGSRGEGYFNQNGGTVEANGLAIGAGKQVYQIDGVEPRSYGEYNIAAGNATFSGTMYIGRDKGIGKYTQTADTSVTHSGSWLVLGNGSDNDAGYGELNIHAGTFTTNATVEGGRSKQGADAGHNKINVSGANTIVNFNGNVQVAMDGANATMSVTNGATVNLGAGFNIGHNGNGTAILNIGEDATVNVTRTDNAGTAATRFGVYDTTTTVNQTGGVFNSLNSDVFVRATNNTTGSATWKISGSGAANVRRLVLGEFGSDALRDATDNTGAAILNLGTASSPGGASGGTFTVGEIWSAQNSNSHLVFDGGKLVASDSAVETGTGNFISENIKTLQVKAAGGTIDTNGKNLTIAKGLSGAGNLTIEGGGAVTFTGDGSGHTGRVNVTEGGVALSSTAVLVVVLDGSQGVIDSAVDALNKHIVSGGASLALADGATLNVVLNNPGALAAGTYIFNIFDGNVTYDKGQIVINSAASNHAYELLDGNQLKLTVVPEPSTYALLGAAGLFGLAVWRRKRR